MLIGFTSSVESSNMTRGVSQVKIRETEVDVTKNRLRKLALYAGMRRTR